MTLLRWHLGLGDALLCNGLVRTLCKLGYEIQIPTYRHNAPSVRAMFADLIKLGHAHVFEVVDDNYSTPEECNGAEIVLGYRGRNFDPTRFDWSFYQQAGVPFCDKWQNFLIGEQLPEVNLKPKEFIHDDKARGFVIPKEGFRPKRDGSLFHYFDALHACEEFHGINSSFAILADLIGITGKKVLHRYARPDGGSLPIFGRQWVYINDPSEYVR